MNTSTLASSKAQRGVSMAELMVAMTITLIGCIIIFQVFEASEGIKRTTSSGGDAQQNGAIALYSLERDIRNSGMGFNDTALAGCDIIGYDSTRTPTAIPPVGGVFQLLPVQIFPGPNSRTPDGLSVLYGSGSQVGSATSLTAPMGSSTDPVRVKSPYGFRPGDLVLLRETPPPAPAPQKSCSIVEVTQVIDDELRHDDGPYTLAGGGSVVSRFNKPGGLGITYGMVPPTFVYNLGNLYDPSGMTLPVHTNWSIVNGALTMTSMFVSSPASQVADNIVHLRVLYGLDDGMDNGTVPYSTVFNPGDGIIDRFVDGNTVPQWERIIAVRLAVVARSALAEIPAAGRGAPCDTTTAEPTWSGSAWAVGPWNFNTRLDLSADPNWQCYRYKTFETTVPLRNWIWRAS